MANDDAPVLAPNATIVNNIEKDPPTATIEFDHPRGDGGVGYVLVRAGYSLEMIDASQEGIAGHHFDTVGDLASYLRWNCSEQANTTDIVVETKQIVVYINPGDEKPQILKCHFVRHPCWNAWKKLWEEPHGQRALIQHCRAWRNTMSDPETLMGALGSIAIVGNSRVSSMIDETGQTRLVGSEDSTDLSVKIPSVLEFESPVYDAIYAEGVDEEEIYYPCELMLNVDTKDFIEFSFAFPKHDLVIRQARQDAARYLQKLLGDAWLVSVGEAHHSTRALG